MSRMGEFLLSVCQERDEVLVLIEERIDIDHEIFFGYGSNAPPSEEFDACYPHAKGYALLLVGLNNAMEVAYANVNQRHRRLAYAMAYSHSVTLLEVFLAESLISLVRRHSSFIDGLAKYYDGFVPKMTLSQALSLSNYAEGKIIELLRNDVFHNPEKIKKIFSSMFNEREGELNISDILPIIEQRHDIVHRNGVNLSGESVIIELEILEVAVKEITQFAGELKRRMTHGVNRELQKRLT
ncbi:hypothetical protein [Pseudomonas sp. Fl4BN1]|uniref:hypothetical protein n=1 Tax=Pseudomonas sp. Fl4BN1 TaxID=2697651 RepID=UPI00137858C3|nr:hypothetical protein [Pseudomonas sp. Fl4BN1]NBF08981.1 hypothetical protein [Pseudomonas sp. Fl4BN1]